MEGYLIKRATRADGSQRRWFVLRGSTLSFAADKEDHPRRSLNVRGAIVETTRGGRVAALRIRIVLPELERAYVVEADDATDGELWAAALSRAALADDSERLAGQGAAGHHIQQQDDESGQEISAVDGQSGEGDVLEGDEAGLLDRDWWCTNKALGDVPLSVRFTGWDVALAGHVYFTMEVTNQATRHRVLVNKRYTQFARLKRDLESELHLGQFPAPKCWRNTDHQSERPRAYVCRHSPNPRAESSMSRERRETSPGAA